MISSLISALRWGVFVSLFLSLLLLVWSLCFFVSSLSSFICHSAVVGMSLSLSPFVCPSYLFSQLCWLRRLLKGMICLPSFCLQRRCCPGLCYFSVCPIVSLDLSPYICLPVITFLGYSVQRQDWYICLPVVFSKIL